MAESSENVTIVIVDDEEMVLRSLNSLLSLETNYAVRTFLSPSEALDFIENHDIDLVVSDYLMPDMDGLSFLDRVKQMRPEVPRIILTGYADKENAIKAINDVGLFQYIEKPWDNNDLLIIFRNGISRNKLLRKLQEKISEINSAYGELQDIQREIVKTFV
ncbi:MAG: response regulator [bacterium]|nr:MAG: response regulator [bacterium]